MNALREVHHRLRTQARLAYWLGPWASWRRSPRRVESLRVALSPGRPANSILYLPRDQAPRGAFLISPGANPDGPADPRMDRFAKVLASGGSAVLSPALPDLMRLKLSPAAVDDLRRAFDVLRARPEVPTDIQPGIFAICLGSLAALRVAGEPSHANLVSGLVLVGGYANPHALFRAVVLGHTADDGTPLRDPLNQPVVFLTLLDHLPGAPSGLDRARLADAWRHYVRVVWQRPEFKSPASTGHLQVAEALANRVPGPFRELFLVGCGARPGAHALCEAALAAGGEAYEFLDPRPHLRGVCCPVHVIHSRRDGVVPFSQLAELAAALPRGVVAGTYPTAVFGHSGPISLRELGQFSGPVRELMILSCMLRAIASCSAPIRR